MPRTTSWPGRGLTWWLIGFSLIAANISTEQFVGMSGQAANWLGMAIASYEWMAAITLVVVAFVFLPTFLRSGIYTIPEFLEYRYNAFARLVMAVATLVILVGVPTASVIYSGAKVITGNFQGVIRGRISTWGTSRSAAGSSARCRRSTSLPAASRRVPGPICCRAPRLIAGGSSILFFALTFLADAQPEELIKTARNQEVTVAQPAGCRSAAAVLGPQQGAIAGWQDAHGAAAERHRRSPGLRWWSGCGFPISSIGDSISTSRSARWVPSRWRKARKGSSLPRC